MNFDEIETFLAVVETANINRAADQLFITQGTASSRIQHIEQELDIQLFFRQKGIKTVTLTPEGECFLPIAQQWLSLWQQAHQIKNRLIFRQLRIASVDMLNRSHFRAFYKDFMGRNPKIQLYLQTEHSTEIHQLIERQQIDMGFVFNLHKSPNVIAYPLFEENCVLLHHKKALFTSTNRFQDLSPAGEVYMTMGKEYDLWHDRVFGNEQVRKISIGSASLLANFMDGTDTWAIAPQSLADILITRDPSLTYSLISEDAPPIRRAYVLFYRYAKPWARELCEFFLGELLLMADDIPALKVLYSKDHNLNDFS